jgi:hypothetical protein
MTELNSVIDLNSRLAVNPNLVLREEDDDCALLFDPDRGTVQLLNRTAVEVWKRLDGQRSLKEILLSLDEIFAGVDDSAEEQVLQLARSLADLGAVGTWAENG